MAEQFNIWNKKSATAILHLPFLSCYRSRDYTLCVCGNNFFCKLPWTVRKYLRCIHTYKRFYIQTFWIMYCIKPSSQATFTQCGYCQCVADMRNSAITGTCSPVHILYTSHNCLQNLILQQATFYITYFISLFLHKLVSLSLFQWAFIINFYRRVSWLQLCSLIRSSIQLTVPYRISQETGEHTLLNFGLWISHV